MINGRNGDQMREWHYDQIYKLIHDLQPGCMIVNNHHLAPFPGEDFQTFERDLPGENSGAGFSADAKISQQLPLEMSDIIGHSWGYVTNDTINRSVKELVHLLIKSAGLGSNLLLNVGPTPKGEIRKAHQERLLGIGSWLNTYGETIYGTRKSWMKPADWGVAVEKGDKVYLHILNPETITFELNLKNFPYQLKKASSFESGKAIVYNLNKTNSELNLQLPKLNRSVIDQVIVLEIAGK
jgi:alpha-L-fucosidase